MNVLWFVADALRYDYARKLHFLRHWAENAITFKNHFAVSHCSDPNFMSLFTGTYPDVHGVLSQLDIEDDKHQPIRYPSYHGIQRWLRERGYRTLMMGPTLPTIYLDGFDEVISVGRKDKTFPGMTGIKAFVRAALGRPWFAMIRTMDCHEPYYGGAYRRATRFTDELAKELFGWVDKEYPDTAIFFLSDHGESLGEHGVRSHLSTLYDVLLHTPMYLKYPGCKPGIINEYTRHVDLFPTVQELLGEQPMGQTLLHPKPRGLMYFVGNGAWREKYWSWRAVRDDKYKYMVSAHVRDGAKFYLFDIRSDPREVNNLADRPEYKAQLHEYADRLCATYDGWPHPEDDEEWQAPYTEEEADLLLQRLQRLGYA